MITPNCAPKLHLIILVFLFWLPCSAQIRSITSKTTLLRKAVADDERIIAACAERKRELQLVQYGKILSEVSLHCRDGCPTRIVVPFYLAEAKRMNISGQISVETIVDENGKVVYARILILKGKAFLAWSARQAALSSAFAPKKSCDNKLLKFRWTIIYKFISLI